MGTLRHTMSNVHHTYPHKRSWSTVDTMAWILDRGRVKAGLAAPSNAFE